MMIAVIASPKPLNSLDRISPLGKISVYEPVAAPAVVRQLLADAADHGPWALQRINVRIIGRTSASDYTADDIEKYFGETTRSFSRPKLSLHIHFASGTATLDNTAKETLRNIGEALSRSTMSDFKFVVGGHTDNVGSAEYNKALSQRRAEAVRNYLEENYSVKGTRLEVVGYGMTRPIDKADTADARALNRRVEFDRQD
jgi:outer membrane protein OmpA-like peptidoglycan-associated protein